MAAKILEAQIIKLTMRDVEKAVQPCPFKIKDDPVQRPVLLFPQQKYEEEMAATRAKFEKLLAGKQQISLLTKLLISLETYRAVYILLIRNHSEIRGEYAATA